MLATGWKNKSVTLPPISENSRRWGEFRLAVVGHLLVCELGYGKLEAELKSLSAKKWNHPIPGQSAVFGYATIQRWYYIARNNPEDRPRALSRTRSDAGIPRATDWPHTNAEYMPNVGDLADALGDWLPDAATRRSVLVDNPGRLYGFTETER